MSLFTKKRHFVLTFSVTQKQRRGRSKFCFLWGAFLSWVLLDFHHCYHCYNQPWSNSSKYSLLAWGHKRRRLLKHSHSLYNLSEMIVTLVILFWSHLLLVVWKCLICAKYSSFAGSVDFLLSFEENDGWSASTSPKILRRCCSKWNNRRRRWCYLLWSVENKRNHHWETVSNAIDAFEPSTARKTTTIRAEARKIDSTAW